MKIFFFVSDTNQRSIGQGDLDVIKYPSLNNENDNSRYLLKFIEL